MEELEIHLEATIEDFATLLIDNKGTFSVLKDQIKATRFKEEIKKELLLKLKAANNRIKESLTLKAILFYTLIPSRKLHGFSKKYSFDAEKQRKLGFKRKVNQYYIYSIFGHFLYLMVFLILVLKKIY